MGEMLARADPLVQMYYGTRTGSFEQDDESVTIFADQKRRAHLTYRTLSDWSRWRCKFDRGAPDLFLEDRCIQSGPFWLLTTFPFHEHLDDISNVSYCWDTDGNFSLLRLRRTGGVSVYISLRGLSPEEALDDKHLEAPLAIHLRLKPSL